MKIAVSDDCGNNPFSLAFFRGHHSVAKAILEIAQAQYAPEEKPRTRYRMNRGDDYTDDEDSDDDSDSGPRVYGEIIGGEFTIENVGQVSMKVNSRTKPLELMNWWTRDMKSDGTTGELNTPLGIVIKHDDMIGLKFLLSMGEYHTAQKLDQEDKVSGFFEIPDSAFTLAVKLGRTQLLAEIIKRTGAGLPLEHLVKSTGIELKEKPIYYQGLTVYGSKRYVEVNPC